MKNIVLFLSVALFISPLTAQAGDVPCDLIIAGSEEEQYHWIFENYEKNYLDGISDRGFMGSAPANTPYIAKIAQEYGLIWWGVRFFLVPSIEAAKEHRQKIYKYWADKNSAETDITLAPFYIIGSEDELGLTFKKDDPQLSFDFNPGEEDKSQEESKVAVPAEKMKDILNRGGFEIDQQGHLKPISAEWLKRRISLNGMFYNNVAHLPSSAGRNSLSQSGWMALKWHGIHDYPKWMNTDSAKKVKKRALQLLNKGYTIRFNHDFVAALNYLRDKQVRTYREAPGADRKAMGAALNRYKDPVQYDMMLGRYQAGEGYSVEIYDPNGELVGGEIGTVEGNIYVGDSVFYGDDIELAKVGTYALMESLYQRGQPYTDPDMVSPYTKSIGGELVTFPDFRQKILSGPKEKITLPETFDPRDEAYWRTFFGDAARRNNQGLTKKLFLMRSPRPTELTARVAAESRFTHDALNLVFVANEEEAKAIAATTTEPSELPLFIIPNREIAKNEDTLAYLKSELSAETPAKVFFVKHAKYPDIDVIKTKMFADFMAFDWAFSKPTLGTAFGKPALAIPAWSLDNKKK